MITLSQPVEGPLLAVLYKRFPNPTIRDAQQCLQNEEIQDVAVCIAEKIRKLAMKEDEERLRSRKSLNNYRQFYVGGVGIGLILSPWSRRPYEWYVFGAYNTKPSKRAKKFCAEMRIMKSFKSARCVCMGSLVVIGELQPDGRSQVKGLTLDPCEACRDDMRSEDYRYLYRDQTQLLTALPSSQTRTLKSIPELMKVHGEDWPRADAARGRRW